MKLYELMLEQDQILKIEDDDDNETILVDPKTKIKTVVPKDPSKPGAIQADERGELTLDPNVKGSVDRGIKPGDTVKVKM